MWHLARREIKRALIIFPGAAPLKGISAAVRARQATQYSAAALLFRRSRIGVRHDRVRERCYFLNPTAKRLPAGSGTGIWPMPVAFNTEISFTLAVGGSGNSFIQ